jgi:hypothetical protein
VAGLSDRSSRISGGGNIGGGSRGGGVAGESSLLSGGSAGRSKRSSPNALQL